MTYVTVCKNTILSNLKNKKNDPTIRVSKGKYGKPRRVHKYHFEGNGEIICDMQNPLPWGARVWIQINEDNE